MTPQDVVRGLLKEGYPMTAGEGRAFAPVNIALCKYWGKRDEQLNLPVTDSLSISLGRIGTHTELHFQPGAADQFYLNDRPLPAGSSFAQRVAAFLDLFREPGLGCVLRTENLVPTAAGIASSASGLAALVLALNDAGDWHLNRRDLSILARLGSGSACRSVFDGFVQWQAGTRADGMDSHALSVAPAWPELRIGIVHVSDQPKTVSSRAGMRRTRETSVLYERWPQRAASDLAVLTAAVHDRDFERLGRVAEANAFSMHATMLDARPPLVYWLPETVRAARRAAELRESGTLVYATMDAGPNVKLLFQASNRTEVEAAFDGVEIACPAETSADLI